jgi:hypothetical protein
MSDINVEETQEMIDRASQLPEPTGFKLLCAVPHVEEEYSGGIIKAESTVKAEEQTTVVLFVVKLGPDAYKDSTRFPSGPWCQVGDFVFHGREFRIINDDTVEGVVDDPRGIRRA